MFTTWRTEASSPRALLAHWSLFITLERYHMSLAGILVAPTWKMASGATNMNTGWLVTITPCCYHAYINTATLFEYGIGYIGYGDAAGAAYAHYIDDVCASLSVAMFKSAKKERFGIVIARRFTLSHEEEYLRRHEHITTMDCLLAMPRLLLHITITGQCWRARSILAIAALLLNIITGHKEG